MSYLFRGSEMANKAANITLKKVREAMGIDYHKMG